MYFIIIILFTALYCIVLYCITSSFSLSLSLFLTHCVLTVSANTSYTQISIIIIFIIILSASLSLHQPHPTLILIPTSPHNRHGDWLRSVAPVLVPLHGHFTSLLCESRRVITPSAPLLWRSVDHTLCSPTATRDRPVRSWPRAQRALAWNHCPGVPEHGHQKKSVSPSLSLVFCYVCGS